MKSTLITEHTELQIDRNSNTILKASLLVALSGILYGFLGYLGTSLLQDNLTISTMLFWRFFIAGNWMLLFALNKKMILKISQFEKKILLFTFILGAIGYAGSSGFYFLASAYTGTGLAMVIFFSYPIVIALTSFIKNRHLNPNIIIILIAMSVGLFLLKDSSGHLINFIGIVFAIAAAASYAFYVMGSKRYAYLHLDSNLLSLIICFSCAFIFLIFSLMTHSFVILHSFKSWMYLLGLGVLATALPIQLMLEGLKHISSMRSSIISVLEPLVTLLVGIALLNESVSHLQLLGAAIIICSTIGALYIKEI